MNYDYSFTVGGGVLLPATVGIKKAGFAPIPKMIPVGQQEGLNFSPPDGTDAGTANQATGVNAFSAVKTLFIDDAELPLIALNYGFFNPVYSSTDMYGALGSDSIVESEMMSGQTTGNAFNNSYTELPIYLASTKASAPFIKGSITDLYWVPANIDVKFITPGDLCTPGTPGITKMLWNGWSMPWIGAELD